MIATAFQCFIIIFTCLLEYPINNTLKDSFVIDYLCNIKLNTPRCNKINL